MTPSPNRTPREAPPTEIIVSLTVLVTSSVIFNLIYLTFVTDTVVLGPNFRTGVMAAVALGAVTSALFTKLATPRIWTIVQSATWRRHLSGARKITLIICFAAAVSAYITATVIWNGVNNIRIAQDVRSASDSFQITLVGRGFENSRTPRTIAKFQQARNNIEPRLPPPQAIKPIVLRLYPNLREYRYQTQMHLADASMRCLPTGAEIWAPLSPLPNPVNFAGGSGAPVHETAHALVCHSLGTEKFHQIPYWFHEGTAETFRNETRTKFLRAMNRTRLWLAPEQSVPSAERLCLGHPGNTADDKDWFYLTALQFTQYLESTLQARPQPDSSTNPQSTRITPMLNQVIQHLHSGKDFQESMLDIFGADCQDLYENWLRTW